MTLTHKLPIHVLQILQYNGDQFGHWDVLWQNSGSTATDCYPGKSGCTGASDNIMDLTQDGGGMFEISKHVGTGANIAMVFDEAQTHGRLPALVHLQVLQTD